MAPGLRLREAVCPRPPSTQMGDLLAAAATTHPAWNKSPCDCILLPWGLKNTMILIIC